MTQNHLTIAIGGQHDMFVASFIHWLYKAAQVAVKPSLIIPSNQVCQELENVSWRLGSLASTRDTENMLADADYFLCFYMTPTDPESQTSEGYSRDVDLIAAYNLANQANLNPRCHTILVTRKCPAGVPFNKTYTFWQQIIKTFQNNCKRLTVIQTDPVLSEADAVTIAMMENASTQWLPKSTSPQWLNHAYPVEPGDLFSILWQFMTQAQTPPAEYQLSGKTPITWQAWHQAIRQSINTLAEITFSRIKARLHGETQLRQQLLEDTLILPSKPPESNDTYDLSEPRPDKTHLLQIITSLARFELIGKDLLLTPVPAPDHKAFSNCYVQRILTNPKRSVPAIADLLMQWLPRYFQRLIQVDNMDSNRRICRLSRIPLLEIEKQTESTARCKLLIRNPWGNSVQPAATLIVTKTSPDDTPGELLIVIEDGPNSQLLNMGIKAILHAFGRYLKDYGVGS